MSHSVVLTPSTWRMNLDGSSHFFHSCFFDRQENSHVSSKTREHNIPRIGHLSAKYSPQLATSLTLSLACFAQRNKLAVSLLSGWFVIATDTVLLTLSTRKLNLDASRHRLSLFCIPYLLCSGRFSKPHSEQFLRHLEPVRWCGLSYPQFITEACKGSAHPQVSK